ncbi:hypothetical protein B0H19DRAFT_1160248 [Mycena capillaripes]|nr:hypothetical protein B0H19DRAFT_1160248 [Mycena capillaripes]
MHFSKTYTELLQALPSELSERGIQYRQLKRLINQLVTELASLGLGPAVLHDLLRSGSAASEGNVVDPAHLEYEFSRDSGPIEPQLRLWVGPDLASAHGRVEEVQENDVDGSLQGPLLGTLLQHAALPNADSLAVDSGNKVAIVIPLTSDSAFFQLLATTLQELSENRLAIRAQVVETLVGLTRKVSDTARPVSSSSTGFKTHSPLKADPAGVRVRGSSRKSDLSTWREIFQLYVEAEIFESINSRTRVEHTMDESETRWSHFVERVTNRGLRDADNLKLPQSRQALDSFFKLNLFILNVKKFELANAEATRKILKKHTKRTALSVPDSSTADGRMAPILLSATDTSLARMLVQELGTTLLPVIPSLDDYSCLICTALAFKPIRLSCGHLFCVRCLVKMQKRGSAQCPMCRAPCVLTADKSNVDWALMNFMRDWFPEEAAVKLRQNESEAAREQMEELGLDPDQRCIVV